ILGVPDDDTAPPGPGFRLSGGLAGPLVPRRDGGLWSLLHRGRGFTAGQHLELPKPRGPVPGKIGQSDRLEQGGRGTGTAPRESGFPLDETRRGAGDLAAVRIRVDGGPVGPGFVRHLGVPRSGTNLDLLPRTRGGLPENPSPASLNSRIVDGRF